MYELKLQEEGAAVALGNKSSQQWSRKLHLLCALFLLIAQPTNFIYCLGDLAQNMPQDFQIKSGYESTATPEASQVQKQSLQSTSTISNATPGPLDAVVPQIQGRQEILGNSATEQYLMPDAAPSPQLVASIIFPEWNVEGINWLSTLANSTNNSSGGIVDRSQTRPEVQNTQNEPSPMIINTQQNYVADNTNNIDVSDQPLSKPSNTIFQSTIQRQSPSQSQEFYIESSPVDSDQSYIDIEIYEYSNPNYTIILSNEVGQPQTENDSIDPTELIYYSQPMENLISLWQIHDYIEPDQEHTAENENERTPYPSQYINGNRGTFSESTYPASMSISSTPSQVSSPAFIDPLIQNYTQNEQNLQEENAYSSTQTTKSSVQQYTLGNLGTIELNQYVLQSQNYVFNFSSISNTLFSDQTDIESIEEYECSSPLHVIDLFPELSIFRLAIAYNGIQDLFQDFSQSMTVFAPDNQAFEYVNEVYQNGSTDSSSRYQNIVYDDSVMKSMLLYHIVPGLSLDEDELHGIDSKMYLLTMEGPTGIELYLQENQVVLQGVGNEAKIVKYDIGHNCSTVVAVHIIDSVLLPHNYIG
eukprot:TRINITY_DN6397_c0_g1_i12.p1 TRINITY_DN6397_c0_g1~~TRINITY_DN6397_c0_g1_i12.p1  ORF type:complete len:586 (-),score=31.89 TRINITY_DN6397_c0_g1_i12:2881-4638(-)